MNNYNERLKAFFDGLTVKEDRYFSKLIREGCGINRAQLYNMKAGRTEINYLRRQKIVELIGRDIFS